MTLTDRQQEVLDFLRKYQTEAGVSPSTREIQEHFGFASQTAAISHLRALERKGALERMPGKARAVRLSDQRVIGMPVVELPIYGAIAAGYSEVQDQSAEGTIAVDCWLFPAARSPQSFVLRVRGESMIGAQIMDGDLVVVERKEPRARDIVAALIDGETTLKRLVVENGQPFLRAENPAFPDLIPLEELSIQGVMMGLIRSVRR